MSFHTCPHCQTVMQVDEKLLGKQVRCPKCHQVGTVAAAAPVVRAVASPALAPDPIRWAPNPHPKPGIEAHVASPPSKATPAETPTSAPMVVVTAGRDRACRATRRRRSNQPVILLGIGGAIVLVAAGIGASVFKVGAPVAPVSPATLALAPIPRQEAKENTRFQLSVELKSAAPGHRPTFTLDRAPSGATIDAATGRIAWNPGEKDGPKEHVFVVRASRGSTWTTKSFVVHVAEVEQPPRLPTLRELAVEPGRTAELRIVGVDPDVPPSPLRYSLRDAPDGATIDEQTGQFRWTPDQTAVGRTVSIVVVASKGDRGRSASAPLVVRVAAAPTTTVVAATPAPSLPTPVPSTEPAPSADPKSAAPKSAAGEFDELLALYDETLPKNQQRKLFAPASYKSVRHWFSRKFEREQEPNLRQAWGADYDEMCDWLSAHEELKEELFTALAPEHDDVTAAMQILARLKTEFSDEVVRYGNLTIATCVVWDRTNGIYDYQGLARHAKAAMPADLADAVDNFRYLIEREKKMEGRILHVPWEYLTLVVNHRTPIRERDWALANYGPRRVMFGKCYHDCPYDYVMLNTSAAQGQLNGQDYDLLGLRKFGGVCAHQADYASRIGKSIGVPAVYVSGKGRFAGLGHAWVMWVELMSVSPNAIQFSLESHGRYQDDHYYVGRLVDPHSGAQISDRDLERRLHAVGANTQGNRQSQLVMRAWPLIKHQRELDFPEQLAYLAQTLGLSAWNEQAWRQLAAATREAELSDADRKEVQKAFAVLFTAFARLPDLTVEVFGDLLAFETRPKKRIDYYVQLLEMYAAAKRPDLSFKALPQLIELLCAEDRQADAVTALATAVKQNANEGEYVPAALDRLDSLCAGDDKLQVRLLGFYGELPLLISTDRGGRVSDYCVKMHQRAIQKFETAGQTGLAQAFRARLQVIQAKGQSPM